MSLPSFLNLLFEHGRVLVHDFAPIETGEIAAARAFLVELEPGYRQTLPAVPPEFNPETATAAGLVLYRACQCIVNRNLDVKQVLLPMTCDSPSRRTASHHYSADIVLRFLPDVWKLARNVSEGDPLVDYLCELAVVWPLSSVGIPGIAGLTTCDLDAVFANRSLLILYADRIIECRDRSRLDDPRAAAAVRLALGPFSELSKEMAVALKDLEREETRPTTPPLSSAAP